MIELLRPHFTNKATELKNPRVYFLDSGLRNFIINNFNELSRRIDAGQITENVAFSQLKFRQKRRNTLKYW